MSVQREMTLEEWVAKLPTIHLAHKEFDALNATITEQAAQIEALEKDAARYQYVRRLNVRQFKSLFINNLDGMGPFDSLVDAAILGESHVR